MISTEFTLDIGKRLQSMPMQITNDPSIVPKVNVVVFVVPSFALGVDEYTEEVLVGLSDKLRELKRTIAANVQLDLKDGCAVKLCTLPSMAPKVASSAWTFWPSCCP